jgi:hypothetical protein
MARPKAVIDQEQFEAFCRLNPTLKDAAAFFKVDQDTIITRCKEWGYEGFSDAREQNMVHTRLTLIRNALKMAEKGNPALMIFCLKNLCGWVDKHEQQITERQITVVLEPQDEKL